MIRKDQGISMSTEQEHHDAKESDEYVSTIGASLPPSITNKQENDEEVGGAHDETVETSEHIVDEGPVFNVEYGNLKLLTYGTSPNIILQIVSKGFFESIYELFESHKKNLFNNPFGYIAKALLWISSFTFLIFLLAVSTLSTYYQNKINNANMDLVSTDIVYWFTSVFVSIVGVSVALICISFFAEDSIRDDIQKIWGKLDDLMPNLPNIKAKVYDITGIFMVLIGVILIVVGAILWLSGNIVAGLFIVTLSVVLFCLFGMMKIINTFRQTNYLMVLTMKKIIKSYIDEVDHANDKINKLYEQLENERKRAIQISRHGVGEFLLCDED